MDLFFQVGELARQVVMAVLINYQHNWLPLLAAIVIAAVMQAFVDPKRLMRAMSKRKSVAILGAVTVGTFTPLCACGTTAVIVGMLSATVPWGPIMAFLTSSPLMSPDGFVMLAGVLGPKFAIGMLVASLVIGLGSGFLTNLIDMRSGFLTGQTRISSAASPNSTHDSTVAPRATCSCPAPALALASVSACCASGTQGDAMVLNEPQSIPCGCGGAANTHTPEPKTAFGLKMRAAGKALIDLGLKQIIPYFTLFVAIGAIINYLVPSSWIINILGRQNISAVPLAALIGLPLYITGDSAVPLVKSLIDGGASGGAMMAFMITGSATSAWVIAGLASFLKHRALVWYTGLILGGGILCGYLFELVLTLGI